jgi:hypothetical protein
MNPIYVNGKTCQVTLPDRETQAAIKLKFRLMDARDNPFGKGIEVEPEKKAAYIAQLEEFHYWVAQTCNVTGFDDVEMEFIGNEIKCYLIQGPAASRPVSFQDLERITGQMLLGDGTPTEKMDQILEAVEIIRQSIQSLENDKPVLAEADVKTDPS